VDASERQVDNNNGEEGEGELTNSDTAARAKAGTSRVVAAFGSVHSMTMLQAWERLVTVSEKARVSKLEIFDEVEEWVMLMNHYCLTTACRNCEL
jgi:hypothetical protein